MLRQGYEAPGKTRRSSFLLKLCERGIDIGPNANPAPSRSAMGVAPDDVEAKLDDARRAPALGVFNTPLDARATVVDTTRGIISHQRATRSKV